MSHADNAPSVRRNELPTLHLRQAGPKECRVGIEIAGPEGHDVQRIGYVGTGKDAGCWFFVLS